MSDASSLGEVTGIAGAVALLGAAGKGVVWFFTRRDRREAELDAKIEARFTKLEHESAERKQEAAEFKVAVDRWRVAFKIVADELATCFPGSPALARARRLLVQAYPTDPFLPPDMGELLSRVDD